jgi:amino acid transporter
MLCLLPLVVFGLLMPVWLVFLLYTDLWPLTQMANNDLCRWAGWACTLWICANIFLPLIFEVCFKMLCCHGDKTPNKPKNCWKAIDIVDGFFLTIVSLGEAVLAVYGVMFLNDMDWTATQSVWFKFSMVAIECALMLHLIKWLVLSLTVMLATCGCIKADAHASASKVSGKAHQSVVAKHKSVDVELSEEDNYHGQSSGYRSHH